MLPSALLAAAAILPYLNILNNGLFLDDLDFIVNNLYIRDWSHFPKLFTESMSAGAGHASDYYRPAMQVAFFAGYSLWKLNPMGYHLLSILFHFLNTILLFRFLSRLGGNEKIAFGTALLFAVHPGQTESVASASALGVLLGMFFGLAALLFSMRSRLWPGLLCTAAALLSKETMVVLPGIVFLSEFYFLGRDKDLAARFKKGLLASAPYLAVAAGYIVLRFTVLNFGGTGNLFRTQNIFTENMSVRFFTFLAVLKELLSILAWPRALFMERSTVLPVYATIFAAPVIVGLFLLAGMVYLSVRLSRSENGFVPFGILWFLFCLVPVSNILIPISTTIVESWLYMSMAGLALVLIYFLSLLPRASYHLALALLCAFASAKTFAQNRVWRDPVAFYEHNLRFAPGSARFRNNLAMAYADEMRYNEAIEQYLAAIRTNDQYPETHHNLANSYAALGRWREAELEYRAAIRMNPRFFHSYMALSSLYAKAGKNDEARALYQKGLAADPRNSNNPGGPSQ